MTYYEGYSFKYHPKFKKEFNKIIKRHKCPTLKEDFRLFIDTLIVNLAESNKFPEHVCMHIAGLDSSAKLPAFIVKKFRCQKINRGANSGFRFTFIYLKMQEYHDFFKVVDELVRQDRVSFP